MPSPRPRAASQERAAGAGDAIVRRLAVLCSALDDLALPRAGDAAALAADRVLRAAVERWLQLAIEACIDIASHVVAAEGWPPPATARDAFRVLASHGRLPAELAERLGAAAGLRNLLVHDYVSVDLDQLARIVRDDLADLRHFAGLAASWLPP
jgi:uncharacterized protein YutE (UPF0331/DUF86 family)